MKCHEMTRRELIKLLLGEGDLDETVCVGGERITGVTRVVPTAENIAAAGGPLRTVVFIETEIGGD